MKQPISISRREVLAVTALTLVPGVTRAVAALVDVNALGARRRGRR